jgi:hypothetical protein
MRSLWKKPNEYAPNTKLKWAFQERSSTKFLSVRFTSAATMNVTGVVLRMADISKAPTKLPRAGLRVGHL